MLEHKEGFAEPDEARPPASTEYCAPVIRLRPIRTLVIARDLAFRERSMAVFVELGSVAFAVISLDPDRVVELVQRQRADVVVLDATGCGQAVAPVVSALYEMAPRVGVVIVAADGGHAAQHPGVLRKWGWAADLYQAVADAYNQGSPLKEIRSHVGN